MDQGEAHVMSLLTIKDMANKGKETKEQRKKRKGGIAIIRKGGTVTVRPVIMLPTITYLHRWL